MGYTTTQYLQCSAKSLFYRQGFLAVDRVSATHADRGLSAHGHKTETLPTGQRKGWETESSQSTQSMHVLLS